MVQRFLKIAAALAALPVAVAASAAFAGGCGAHGECYDRVRTPDVYATVARPVVVAPARTEVYHSPAVYGTVARTVEVAPARAYSSTTPAVYGTVNKEIVVAPGGYRWQHTVDRSGRERLCKVATPAVTRTVKERVLLQPAQRVTHVTPAVHKDVHRTVVLKEAATHTVHRPALVGYQHQSVLVKRGGSHWQRSW